MFEGYSDKTVDFFWQIRFNNSREWFQPRKEEFNAVIMQPTKDLANELFDWFQENYPELHLNLHVSRIYRDARRLFGRGPLKDHIWFSFQNEIENRSQAPCFWFEIGCDGYSYGMGFYSAGADVMQRYRKQIDLAPAKLEKLAEAIDKQDTFILEGPEYAKAKGRKGEKLEHWYNKRYLALICARSYDALSYSPALADALKEGYRFLMPYYQYMDKVYRSAE